MRYILFGTGDCCERYRKWFSEDEIVCYADNAESKQGTYIDGIPVKAPAQALQLPFDLIVVMSYYFDEIRQQLISMGVKEDKILHFRRLRTLPEMKERAKKAAAAEPDIAGSPAGNGRRILLLSFDLELGGPAIALFRGALALKDEGYDVCIVSMTDGDLKNACRKAGIPVFVLPSLQILTMKDYPFAAGFDLLICNTINFYHFLSEMIPEKPVIWWLHDSVFFYAGITKEDLRAIDRSRLTILSVGPVPAAALKEFLPEAECSELLYGVADEAQAESAGERLSETGREASGCLSEHTADKKLRFLTVGYVEWRKGQDVLLKAAERLDPTIRAACRFDFVGQKSSAFAAGLLDRTADTADITFHGRMDRNALYAIYEETDVLIVPSREDPMPTVAAEAMMHGIPCIVSDACGTSAYIKNYENGLVFRSEDEAGLAGQIAWCCERREELARIGKQARILFETVFSDDVFRRILAGYVHGMLKDTDGSAAL